MNYRIFLLGLLGLFLITSCQKSIYSEREQALFMSPIFGHDISIDSIETIQDLVVLFDKIYCENKSADKWPVLYFDIKAKKLVNPSKKYQTNILTIGIEPSPCSDVMFEYDYSRILEVVKDGYNLEVEGQRIEPDSLTQYVSKQYLNYGVNPKFSPSPENNGIWLITNKDDKLSNLNKYIAQLVEGYVVMANQYAEIAFKQPLEELSDEEFAQLKKSLAFHLSFKYSDVPPQIKVGF